MSQPSGASLAIAMPATQAIFWRDTRQRRQQRTTAAGDAPSVM